MKTQDLKLAVICASNQNRSMEAHELLMSQGFNISSFGTNSQIKIPGVQVSKPNVYPFGTSYEHIARDLKEKDESFYRAQGLLEMVERNSRVKEAPERFQDADINFDIIITCEDRCWEIVVDNLLQRSDIQSINPVHVVGFHIPDTRQNAINGAKKIAAFADKFAVARNFDNDISNIIEEFCKDENINLSYCVQYY